MFIQIKRYFVILHIISHKRNKIILLTFSIQINLMTKHFIPVNSQTFNN